MLPSNDGPMWSLRGICCGLLQKLAGGDGPLHLPWSFGDVETRRKGGPPTVSDLRMTIYNHCKGLPYNAIVGSHGCLRKLPFDHLYRFSTRSECEYQCALNVSMYNKSRLL